MTLNDFFELCRQNPIWIVSYFIFIPLAAYLAGVIGRDEGEYEPWRYFYSALIYMVCVPGIFAITLAMYLFLFERQSILNADLITQFLPVFSMIVTLLIIRKNVNLEFIPGFDKLGGLVTMILGAILIMWFFDKTRIWMISVVRFEYVLLILVGLLVAIRFGWKRVLGGNARQEY